MKGFIIGAVVTLLAITGAVVLVSRLGLYPIGADNPPSRLERRLASTAMNVYVDKHKPEGDNPAEITPANLMSGAKDYEDHCAFCHGGAKAKISPMQHKFNPPAPQMVNRIPHDPDPWLFWVTKHGVRMTGMPSWDGVLKDEQMWNIVAFIKHSDKLPPEVQAAWEQMGSIPGVIEEHAAPGPGVGAR